jgi:hypothetical protein
MFGWIIALFIVYWQFILAYVVGGALYSILKWVIQLYRLRNKVLALDTAGHNESYIREKRAQAAQAAGFNSYSYPPKVTDNKSTLFWWAVGWPLNLVWTLVADVAKEAWDWLYRKFGGLYDYLAKAILPE